MSIYHRSDGKMHRVGSVGRLADSCGTASEMLGRFAAKTAGLCCVVFGLAVFDPPGVVREILYGEAIQMNMFVKVQRTTEHVHMTLPDAAIVCLKCCTQWWPMPMHASEVGRQLTDNTLVAAVQHWDCMHSSASSWMALRQPSPH